MGDALFPHPASTAPPATTIRHNVRTHLGLKDKRPSQRLRLSKPCCRFEGHDKRLLVRTWTTIKPWNFLLKIHFCGTVSTRAFQIGDVWVPDQRTVSNLTFPSTALALKGRMGHLFHSPLIARLASPTSSQSRSPFKYKTNRPSPPNPAVFILASYKITSFDRLESVCPLPKYT